jgi:malate dehydrogenase
VKVTIVGGAGGVGASTAFNLLLIGGGYEVVLVDTRPTAIVSHVMDFEQVVELSPGSTARAGKEADIDDTDILVVTAAVPLTLNTSRLVYLADNVGIMDNVVARLRADWPGVVLVVTNPVDPLVTRIQRRSGLDRRQVVGYTINDSLRFRTGLAKALGVEPGRVEAWVLGEHGEKCVPLFDRVTVNGERVEPTTEQASLAAEYLHTWYERHVALDSGRSSTWTSGLGVARMVAAIAHGGDAPLPASVVLEGEYGISGVAVTVPVALGPSGVEQIHEWTLCDDDLDALRASADLVRDITDGIG